MQDKNKNNVSLPVVNQSPAPSNGQTNPGTSSKINEQSKVDKGSLPSLGGFKFETKATDVYKRGLIGKGRDFFSLKENAHVEYSKNEDILHNYFFRYINEKKNHWMPQITNEIIVNAQGAVVQVSGTEIMVRRKETDVISKESAIKGVKRLSSNLQKPGTPLKKLSGDIEFKQVNMLGRSIDQEFHEATSIQKSGRTTLYSTIINTNENLIKIAESSIKRDDSPITSIIQQSKYDAKTYIDQTQRSYNSNLKGIHQLNAPLNSSYLIDKYSKKYDINIAKDFASGLYIPLTQRQLKYDNRTKKQRRLNPLANSNQFQIKKIEDQSQSQTRHNNQSPYLTAKQILEQIQHISPTKQQINKDQQLDIILSHSQTIFQDDQSNFDQTEDNQKVAQTERNQTLQNALHLQLGFLEQENINQLEQQQRQKTKRQSFSLCQTKFDDARAAVDKHPLLHAKMKGPILIDLETIYKMKKAKRYPIPEKILHTNNNFQLQIDSIIRQAYDNDEIEFAANNKQEIDAPCNSMESNEKIEFYSSGSEYEILHDQELTDKKSKQKVKNESDILQIVKKRKNNKYQSELPPDTKEARAYEDKMQSIKIHKDAIDLQGFDIELLKGYPKNHTEGDIPSFLIKNEKRLAGYTEIQKLIKEEFDSKILLPTSDHIQLIFELFCKEFNCQPFTILKYFHSHILNYQNYFLSLQQVKALCCTIPLIPRLKKIQFCNNNLTDEMSTLIILSAFMNPAITEISIQKNYLKRSAINTLKQLLYHQSNKIMELDISGSIEISNSLEQLIYNFGSLKGMRDGNGNRLGFKLKSLDVSNIQLSSSACMHIGSILINTQNLRQINLQRCQISGLGTRYIIDSLNQNIGLQFFNFSHNNMGSNVYENSVKIAKIIARHQEMMHYDLTNTSLLREEVIFIGMALPISRSCIGIHMSGNGLEYYDRVFLRTLIDAKVAYHFKNLANLKNNNNQQVRQSENNHYNQLENEEQRDDELSQFIRTFNYIEKQKIVLNEELATILQESDFLQLFRTIRKGKQKNSNAESLSKSQQSQQKLVDLINKINDRQKLIDNQQKEMLKYSEQNLNLNDPLVIKNLTTMGLYKKIKNEDETDKFESDGQEEKIININKNQQLNEDLWLMQNSLKVERIRQRVQLDALKHIKSKSSAEIALMFTSINKIAYDILMQNPMTAYMTEVVFTRILGNDDVEQSQTWKDCTQCWICEKWSKNKIEFKNEYLGNMRQKINQVHELHDVLEKCLDSQNHHMLKKIGIKNLSLLSNNRYNKQQQDSQDDESQKTLSKDILETQTINTESDIEIGNEQKLDQEIINPIILDRAKIENMLPENHRAVKSIHRLSPQNQQEISESSDDDLLSDSNYRHKFNHQNIQVQSLTPLQQTKSSFNHPQQFSNNHPKFQQAKKLQQNTFQQSLNINDFQEKEQIGIRNSQQYKQSKNLEPEQSYASKIKQQQVEQEIKYQNHKKRQEQVQKRGESSKYKKDGQYYRLKQKKVYFQGVYHLVDYEVKVDSDENSSGIDTSDDEFKVDSEFVINQFNQAVSKKIHSLTANQQQLQEILIRNQPRQFNVFGRKQVFLCASYNDWVPVEMKKIKEIKLEIQHGDNLASFLNQNQDKIESQKEINNIIQNSSFVPPGRHFFYFIFNNSQIILSSNHQIVRFGDSSVFLNEIEVEQRIELPKKYSLKQNRSNQDENVFKKERSVFKTYQEDDPDFVCRMLKCDLKYSKIERLCQRSEKADKVLEILEKHYVKLKSIYNYYIANSTNYPRMSIKDFTQICYRCKLFDRNLNLVSMERNLVTTNTSTNPYKNSDDKELNRYEFLEVLVRTAKSKYQDPKIFQSLNDALEILLSKDFMPHCKFLDGVKFRAQYVFHQQVDEIFRKNDQVIRQLFQYSQKLQPIVQEEEIDSNEQKKQQQGQKINDQQKQFQISKKVEKNISQLTKSSATPEMTTPNIANNQIQLSIVNIRELCLRANLNIKVLKINQNFVESLMSRIDTMKDPTLATNMRFAEFLIFIAKTAFDIYQGTREEEDVQLAQKIDVILDPLLSVAGLQKKFSFLNRDQQSSSEEKDNDSEME